MIDCPINPKVYYQNNKISITYPTPMNLKGVNSILISSNYTLNDGTNDIPFDTIVLDIFSYSKFHVTFNIKNLESTFDFLSCNIKFKIIKTPMNLGVTEFSSLDKGISYSLKIDNYTTIFSLSDYVASSTNSSSITLSLPCDVCLSKINTEDFYINKNNYIFNISNIEALSLNSFIFNFDTCIFTDTSDVISLHTWSTCTTTDIFGNLITKDDHAMVINSQENTMINAAISSYSNNVLEITANFKIPLIRYDGSDFELLINNKSYQLSGHSTNTRGDMTLKSFLNNTNFNDVNSIILRGKKNILPYTVDNRFITFTNSDDVLVKSFYSTLGKIYLSISTLLRDYIKINISFNKSASSETIENYYLATIQYDYNLYALALNIPKLGTFYVYGDNLEVPTTSYTAVVLAHVNNNVLELFINISSYNFILINYDNLNYYSFKFQNNLKSTDNLPILTSHESLLNEEISSYSCCKAEDEGANWSLLSKTTNSSVILVLDTKRNTLTYGSLATETIINGDVYFLPTSSTLDFNEYFVNLINLKVNGNIYILTVDSYDYNFESCDINNIFIFN